MINGQTKIAAIISRGFEDNAKFYNAEDELISPSFVYDQVSPKMFKKIIAENL